MLITNYVVIMQQPKSNWLRGKKKDSESREERDVKSFCYCHTCTRWNLVESLDEVNRFS